ncbi:hypothetical protein TCDM_08931 [Trypanosoma cruzi Dm28c]|uniref:Transmembrane protein n=1 Tax=Trypanosoma cruzi Dm28c TaxID=1416333 RepID=V5B6N8_TRYCR|nr:hypothetical protein TCDM_08931 [Trypanosoma cruzi Dm28c]
MRGSVICRGHAQVCTISAASGSLFLVVPWDGEERAWSRTVPPASTEQGLPGASVSVAESIETSRGTTPKDVDSAAPQASVDSGEVDPSGMPRKTARSFSRRQGPKQRDGRQAGHASDSRCDTAAAACPCPLLLLLASATAVATLYGFCGVFGVALRGNCASSCVARTQHWMPNRKTSISLGSFLHMHVLYGLRLTFYLRLVVFPMQIAFLVLVADVGPPYSSIDCLCVF